MKINLYSVWSDPVFYAAATVFVFGMFFLVFSIRKYLELKNKYDFEGSVDEDIDMQQGELPLEEAADGATAGQPGSQATGLQETPEARKPEQSAPVPSFPPQSPSGHEELVSEMPNNPSLTPEAGPQSSSKAEEFVKGLYQNLASMDGRLKNIETSFAKSNVNRDFAVTFLEDIVSDFDTLDKDKIKARIEYLVFNLKK